MDLGARPIFEQFTEPLADISLLPTKMVLPPRFIGETTTHIGTFKLLAFVDSLRVWCLNVYAKQFASLLRALGNSVGWSESDI